MRNDLKYKDFFASVEYDAEDMIFVGHVLGLRDTLSFHGSSVEELTENFHKCIEDYLDICKRNNREPDKSYTGMFNVRVPSDLHRRAAMLAGRNKIKLNQFVKIAIENECARLENKA